ncbi:PREDICTED: major facilitator superfamily domain-containing protein 8-like [Nanorana parkeri]|uniref:major facilitator superfamily domain-containing protein 8-like n=1 Tax=Nanorana parkeri TaxID=125878 RepID=UPI000854D643|nr:PREDICTED: major facilitator superfamily domain-containing protein 8-like [Nanorana parkeri]
MDPQADDDNVLKKKQRLTNVVIGFIFLLSGIEYAVILPTVWMYLQALDAQPFFLGLVLSAFSLTELLSGPVFGYWSDRTGKTKHVILLSNCFEIAGNFMYFVGISKWFLLASRLVAGIGAGAGASIFGYLTQHSSSKDRIPVFAMAMACRQAGLLIGPAFNIFLRYCTFPLGPFHVDKFSAPGIFMCILWTLIQFMVIFMFYDVPMNATQSLDEEHEPLLKESDIPSPLYGTINSEEPSTNQEDFPVVENASINTSCATANDHVHQENIELDKGFQNVKPGIGLLREEIVVLLTAQFVTFFNQTALETLVTPLAQTYLAFQDLQNSLIYFLCGIEMLICFLIVRTLSRCCTDRLLLALGLFICNISCIWCLIFLAKPKGSYGFLLAEFIIGVFLQVLGLPFVSVSQVSLFSKVTAEKTQGFNHGIRRSVGGLATILGPLWAAGLTQNLYIMLGVMMGLLLLITIMFSLSYKYLVEPAPSETETS